KRYKLQVDNAWVQIESYLQRRVNIIEELLETAKSEPNTDTGDLSNALSLVQTETHEGIPAKRLNEEELSYALESFFNTQDNPKFATLKEALKANSNRIKLCNKFYKDQAIIYNTRLSIMPTRMIARVSGLKSAVFFDIHLPMKSSTDSNV
ncbi:MAG: LemA family protein, partial [Lentisphaerae bacterium]|nr:LemA family protein [Lentisphaerota bacterium]